MDWNQITKELSKKLGDVEPYLDELLKSDTDVKDTFEHLKIQGFENDECRDFLIKLIQVNTWRSQILKQRISEDEFLSQLKSLENFKVQYLDELLTSII
ncbi:MAG: hypothetical protein NT038_08020 [Euryarchaeota archaeon]|nr:hypothetical protein [Euryarchaeota archaeon]